MPTSSGKVRVAWDATVCIKFLNRDKDTYPGLRAIVEDAKARKLELVVSTLAIAETTKLSDGPPDEQVRQIDAFFDASYIKVYAFERFIAQEARRIRNQYPMASADAGHIATAVFAECDSFLTDDGNGAKTKRNLLKYDGLIDVGKAPNGWKLKIVTPYQYDQQSILATHPLMAQATATSEQVSVVAQAEAPVVPLNQGKPVTPTKPEPESEPPPEKPVSAPGGT